MTDPRPVLFVTGHAPPDRVPAFEALHAREEVVYALFGGRDRHGATHVRELGVPHRACAQLEAGSLAASGHHRAVVASSGGRLALPAAWAGARRARVPLVLWTSLWAHPRTPAHLAALPLMHALYRRADAVVAYGPHVADFVRARGARNVHLAPQAVDNAFWATAPPADAVERARCAWGAADFRVLFVGRSAREKGAWVLERAWRASGLSAPGAALVLAGGGPKPAWAATGGAATPDGPVATGGAATPDGPVATGATTHVGALSPEALRNFYAAADVLVVPSIPTLTFREPWALVVNEAMNQGLPTVCSDAVGAAAGGLVRDGRNGVIVPAGDPAALAGALRRLQRDPAWRAELGRAARRDVAAYTPGAWARGFSAALASVGVSHARPEPGPGAAGGSVGEALIP